jgi:hypothetical protein
VADWRPIWPSEAVNGENIIWLKWQLQPMAVAGSSVIGYSAYNIKRQLITAAKAGCGVAGES